MPAREHFNALADELERLRRGDEVVLLGTYGEDSDFVRLNRNRIRQAGRVLQQSISVDLIEGRRHAVGECNVTGALEHDRPRLRELVDALRARREHVPEDPHLLYATEVRDTTELQPGDPPDSAAVVEHIVRAAQGMDLVGIWASGTTFAGFANSLGQRNWFRTPSFNFDWSCYQREDKAVKCTLAGSAWDPAALERKMSQAREQLALLGRPARTVDPGRYRVYLAPAALREILGMLAWDGFSLKAHRTYQTPLLKMIREGRRLHRGVTLLEDRTGGLAPRFTPSGFIKSDVVTLIDRGEYKESLVGPRSGKEYGEPVNSGAEFPESLALAAGEVPADEVVERLGTGLYVNNLWYCNYSDRNDCRITGMTRFACFWVEQGRLVAPVEVMRFDESVYRMLGEHLVGFTREREFLHDPGSYHRRSTASMRLPGALVQGFTLTL